MSLGQVQEQWVSFRYEGLPKLCYWCNYLTYDDKDCEVWFDSEGFLTATDQQFEPWLRATPVSRARKNMVSVLGFYKKTTCNTSMPRAPITSRRVLADATTTPPRSMATPDIENSQSGNLMNPKLPFSTGSVTAGHNNSSPNFMQHHNHEDPFMSQLEEIDRELKRFDLPNNKAWAVTPPAANLKLAPPQKESIPIITPTKQS